MAFNQSSQQRNGTTAGRSSRQQGGWPRNAGHVTPLQETAERVDRMIPPSPPKQEASNASFTSEVSSAPSVQQTPRPQQPAAVQHAVGPQGDGPAGPSEFRERLWQFCCEGKFWDVNIVSGQERIVFPVSKAVVSAESKFFREQFAKDSDAKELVVAQFPAHVLKQVLEFAYRGKLDAYSTPGLREAADFLGMSELQKHYPKTPAKAPAASPQQPAASPQQAAASPQQTFASPQSAGRPGPITKHNVVQEILASLKAGDVKRQDEIIAFIRANPKEAAEVAVSEQMSLLATSQPEAYDTVQRVLATFKQ